MNALRSRHALKYVSGKNEESAKADLGLPLQRAYVAYRPRV